MIDLDSTFNEYEINNLEQYKSTLDDAIIQLTYKKPDLIYEIIGEILTNNNIGFEFVTYLSDIIINIPMSNCFLVASGSDISIGRFTNSNNYIDISMANPDFLDELIFEIRKLT